MMDDKNILLDKMLSRAGDLGFRRRVITLLGYLDIEGNDSVLDCGCGEGFYTAIINELYDAKITAFDFNAELLEKAATWVKNKEKIRFINGDIANGLPFEDNTFDKVIFTEVLEHLDDDRKALREIYRVIKKGGVVGLTVPNANYPLFWDPLNWTRKILNLGHFNPKNTVLGGVWSYDHKRLYEHETIKKLAKEVGFKVLKAESLTHYCFPFNYLVLRLGKLFYTKLPVSQEIKNSMEKFNWNDDNLPDKVSLINTVFKLFKWIDSYNDNLCDVTAPPLKNQKGLLDREDSASVYSPTRETYCNQNTSISQKEVCLSSPSLRMESSGEKKIKKSSVSISLKLEK